MPSMVQAGKVISGLPKWRNKVVHKVYVAAIFLCKPYQSIAGWLKSICTLLTKNIRYLVKWSSTSFSAACECVCVASHNKKCVCLFCRDVEKNLVLLMKAINQVIIINTSFHMRIRIYYSSSARSKRSSHQFLAIWYATARAHHDRLQRLIAERRSLGRNSKKKRRPKLTKSHMQIFIDGNQSPVRI